MIYDRNVNDVLEFGYEKKNADWFDKYDFACSVGGYRTTRTKKSRGESYTEEVFALVYDLEKDLIATFNGTMVKMKDGRDYIYVIYIKTESFGRWFAADTLEEALDFAKKLHDANLYDLDY